MNNALEARSIALAGKIDQTIAPGHLQPTAFEIAENASEHIATLAAAMRPELLSPNDWESKHGDSGENSAYQYAEFWGIEYAICVDTNTEGGTTVTANFQRFDSKGFRVDYRKPCTTTAEVAMAAVTLLGLIYREGAAR